MAEVKTAHNRIDWIDVARGYGVILVILGHMDLGDAVTTVIYSFHMPLFFILSGMVLSTKDGFIAFAEKKVRTLVVPYFVLGIPLLISEYVKAIYSGTFDDEVAISWLIRFLLQKRLWTLWFLAALFIMELVFYWVSRLKNDPAILTVSALISLAGYLYCSRIDQPLVWNADLAAACMIYMAIGYLARKRDLLPKAENIGKPAMAGLAVTAMAGCLMFAGLSYKLTGQTLMLSYDSFGMPVCTCIAAVLGSLAIMLAAQLHYTRWAAYIGRNTWIYFAWNQAMLLPLINFMLEQVGFAPGAYGSTGFWIHRLIEFAFVITVSTLITRLFVDRRTI